MRLARHDPRHRCMKRVPEASEWAEEAEVVEVAIIAKLINNSSVISSNNKCSSSSNNTAVARSRKRPKNGKQINIVAVVGAVRIVPHEAEERRVEKQRTVSHRMA